MDISFLDLRKKPGKLLSALDRQENITLTRRGKSIARIVPVENPKTCNAADHPAFGMWNDRADLANPAEAVRSLRQGRTHAF